MHREGASGSIHEPKPIHLNDVFLAFDVDGDGVVDDDESGGDFVWGRSWTWGGWVPAPLQQLG